MKHILIANNENITEKTIDSLDIKDDDFIFLFNHMYPLKFNKIKNHKNLICVLRFKLNKDIMSGFKEYYFNNTIFKKVLIFYSRKLVTKKEKRILDKYKNFIEKEKILDYTSIYKKASDKLKITYPSGSCTLGFSLLIYLLYKNIEAISDFKSDEKLPVIRNVSDMTFNDNIPLKNSTDIAIDKINNIEKEKIVLVGFTGIYNGNLLKKWHRCDFEQEFYNKLIKKKLIKKVNPDDAKNSQFKSKIIIKPLNNNLSNIKKVQIKKIKKKK